MQGFVQMADRQQTTLLPECLDDWVDENNPVRAADVFVEARDLRGLEVEGVVAAGAGRAAYHPSPMLKLYIYGYLNRVQSSRRLEREAGRNLEVMWLTGRLAPDHKTIADFRKDNGRAIKKVCAQFVELCRKMGLLTKAGVAIDGSKFKAVNSRDNNFTQGKIQRRQKQIEESVARYMSQLDTNPPTTGGRFKGVSYFNGGLFHQPARLEILDNELVLLRQAAAFDWSKVQPEVFGTLFQHSMDAKERHAFGAEFTHPSDIMKIVGPTIVAPWREQIEGARTLKRLRELLHRLHQFRVLDPACGCGNFLYLAYRELKRLEARIYERMAEFASQIEPGQMRLS